MKLPSTPFQYRHRNIAMLAVTNSVMLDICAPLDVFSFVNLWMQMSGLSTAPVYSLSIIAHETGPVDTTSGIKIFADRCLDEVHDDIDTLLVAGGIGNHYDSPDPQVITYLRRMAMRVRRIASICTGAFLLAESGLLNGRKATTHWMFCEHLAQKYPHIQVDADRIFVRDGHTYTSGGVTSGIDLALALVEEDWGHKTALMVARAIVVFMSRPGGQSQFSALLLNEAKNRKDFRELQAWMSVNLQADLSIETLAERMAMSPRNFSRVFTEETGTTPAKFVEIVRLEAARNKLERTLETVDAIAAQCGFSNTEHMRRTFQRHLKISPQDYRERFRSQAVV
ncbi:MAG: GlxA family transcriptional regulator [Gammaproteobacteria bacterium]